MHLLKSSSIGVGNRMDSNILRAINLFIYSKTLNLHLMCVSACKYMYRVCAWPGKVRRGYQIPGAIDGYEPLYGRLDPLGKRMDAKLGEWTSTGIHTHAGSHLWAKPRGAEDPKCGAGWQPVEPHVIWLRETDMKEWGPGSSERAGSALKCCTISPASRCHLNDSKLIR